MIVVNLLLAIVWVALTGDLSVVNFLAGFVLGYAILAQMSRAGEIRSPYFGRMRRALRLAWAFTRELARSNLKVAYEVLTPRHRMKPGIVAIPLDTRTDAETLLLANLITLTPGSLTLEIDPATRTLYMHDMYVESAEETRRAVKEGFERLVKEAMQ
jgi:multicomponent Na+:H+ antiporter subunit E